MVLRVSCLFWVLRRAHEVEREQSYEALKFGPEETKPLETKPSETNLGYAGFLGRAWSVKALEPCQRKRSASSWPNASTTKYSKDHNNRTPPLTFRTYQILPHTNSYFHSLYSYLGGLCPPGVPQGPLGEKV